MDNQPSAEAGTSGKPGKPSQAEAMKRILERKKQAQRQAQGLQDGLSTDVKKMKNQINKRPNNQKRRTGV